MKKCYLRTTDVSKSKGEGPKREIQACFLGDVALSEEWEKCDLIAEGIGFARARKCGNAMQDADLGTGRESEAYEDCFDL